MSKTPNYDTKIKAILDATKPGERTCALTGEKWMMDEREIEWLRRFNMPPSPHALMTRWFLMGGLLSGYEWWWNKHAETGKPILTYVHPATGVKVLPPEDFLQKDHTSFGVAFDVDSPFFDQLLRLRQNVPVAAFFNTKEPQNSIAMDCMGDVNSYFTLSSNSKNSFFLNDSFQVDASSDVCYSHVISRSHEVLHSRQLYNCRCVYESSECQDSAFLLDCRGCVSCFGVTNKRNRKFVYFNQQFSQAEYEQTVRALRMDCRSVFEEQKKKFFDLVAREAVWPENFNERTSDSTGDYLQGCVRCRYCFLAAGNMTDCDYCQGLYGTCANNYFLIAGANASEHYTSIWCNEGLRNHFGMNLAQCSETEYCLNCVNCEYCFGCVGLNRKRYCILNKQFTEQEYWERMDAIKCAMLERGEYGQIYSPAFSTSPFLESFAGRNMGADVAWQKRLRFPEFDVESTGAIGDLSQAHTFRDSNEVPDCIEDVATDAWAGVPMLDVISHRRFAYLRPELNYYRERKLPAPTRHFIARIYAINRAAPTFVLEDAACFACHKPFSAAKNLTFPNRKIYCRSCYLEYLEKNG